MPSKPLRQTSQAPKGGARSSRASKDMATTLFTLNKGAICQAAGSYEENIQSRWAASSLLAWQGVP